MVDARGAYDDGLRVVRTLADAVESNRGALLVLISRPDIAGLDALFRSGATHYLASPFGELEFATALRFAARHAERLLGGAGAARGRAELISGEARRWSWREGAPDLVLSPALMLDLDLDRSHIPLAAAWRRLGLAGAGLARQSVERLLATGAPTAFACSWPGAPERRMAHHLRREADGVIVGQVEELEEGHATSRSRDVLTGAVDAAGLREWLDERLAGTGEPAMGCVLILLAISRFETINTIYGTGAGDAVLRGLARRIEQAAGGDRQTRCVARVAGAEFAVALAGAVGLQEAGDIARDIAEAVARPFVSGDRVAMPSCRVGIAISAPADDATSLLRRASTALAEAKLGEAGTIKLLDAAGETAAARESRLEIDLRAALDRDEIDILFQPQVSISGGGIIGVEALARWRHPDLGELGAPTLFAAAARSDYLLQLSEHVQAKAVRMAAAWPAALGHVRLAVNVTATDVARSNFTERFLALVDDAQFPRSRLTVEITESGLIEDLGQAAALLARLRAAGLRVAIDDFGTGYSSLAYLKALPLDYLKIDKRLAEDITGSSRDRIVVRGVIEMARSLGLAVVAEGVETQEQLSLLAAEGCNYYQGFLCAPPLAVPELAALVTGRG